MVVSRFNKNHLWCPSVRQMWLQMAVCTAISLENGMFLSLFAFSCWTLRSAVVRFYPNFPDFLKQNGSFWRLKYDYNSRLDRSFADERR